MTAYRCTWKMSPVGPLDGSTVRPDTLCRLSPEQFANHAVRCGRELVPLGDLWHITPGADTEDVLAITGHDNFIGLGAEMAAGTLEIAGPAGQLLGAGMTGGRIHVRGNAGQRTGAGQRGGRIIIDGDVGDLLGGPRPGAEFGMTGGAILVQGRAGEYVGLRQRRGLIVVAGELGSHAGLRLAGGTLVTLRGAADQLGLGMTNGTIVTCAGVGAPLPTFVANGPAAPVFLRLLARRLAELGFAAGADLASRPFHHYLGDSRYGLRGELFVG